MTYGLVMIVKDEAEALRRTLPTLAPLIDTWTVVDTGSRDATEAVVREELAGIPGELHHRPWVNFGHNRSEALALAPEADWLILADADMAWTVEPDFVPDPAVDAYAIEMGDGAFSWRLPLLVNGAIHWKSVGAVHEVTVRADGQGYVMIPTDAVRISMPAVNSSREKLRWHAELLRAELQADPANARSTFYLAQTLRQLGDVLPARALYRRRAEMGGWAEEVYYAAWQAASLIDGTEAVPDLLAAWELRPERLEALGDALRRLNAAGSHRAAWLLSGVDLTVPGDSLFVHREVWDWQITFERSIAAWWVGERTEFVRLTESLLANPRLPEHIRAQVLWNAAL